VRRLRALHHVQREGRQLGNGRLVVIDQPDLEAFAIPTGDEHHGRIVVSSGMLRTLATLIAAANPILFTLPAAIHHLTERWADEAAAATTDDRHLTARTLARESPITASTTDTTPRSTRGSRPEATAIRPTREA
jgi:hypothetical protein